MTILKFRQKGQKNSAFTSPEKWCSTLFPITELLTT